jgi:transcriptional regulator with XRE-family HTH domain
MSKIVTSGDRIVGSRLRLRRKQRAVSERRMADILGVSERDVQAYERGEARIGAERLAKASEALGAPVAFFFSGFSPVDLRAADTRPSRDLVPSGAGELLSAYSQIASSRLRAAVLRLALHLARGGRAAVSLALAEANARKRHWH